jgi:hypothetical protein
VVAPRHSCRSCSDWSSRSSLGYGRSYRRHSTGNGAPLPRRVPPSPTPPPSAVGNRSHSSCSQAHSASYGRRSQSPCSRDRAPLSRCGHWPTSPLRTTRRSTPDGQAPCPNQPLVQGRSRLPPPRSPPRPAWLCYMMSVGQL